MVHLFSVIGQPRHWLGCADGFSLFRRVLGIVVLTAGVLKAHELVTESFLASEPFVLGLLRIGLIGFEFLFGMWLLSGRSPRPTWLAACVFFSVVAGVAGAKAFSGAATCDCFGKAALSPWLAFTGDVVAVLLLCAFPPQGSEGLIARASTKNTPS